MTHAARLTFLAVGALAAACATAAQAGDPAALVGCYYFDQDQVARDLQLPWGVRLTDRSLEGWPALQPLEHVRVASTLTGRDEADHPFGYWRPLAADSILVGYPAGGGLDLHLAPGGDGLVGTARPVGDAGLDADRSPRPISLLHARCPEEL